MVIPLSQYASMPRLQNAGAAVQVAPTKVSADVPFAVLRFPAQANNVSLVNRVLRDANIAQIAKAIVSGVVVDVVDYVRLLVVGKKPGNAMSKVLLPAELDVMVSPSGACVPRWRMRFNRLAGAANPKKLAGGWAVSKVIADRFWNNFCSHIVSPHGLVRGSVVGATDTPILTRESDNGR